MLRNHDKIQTLTVFHHQAGCPHAWMQFWQVDTGSDLSFQHSAIKFFTKKRNPFQAAWMQHMQDIRLLCIPQRIKKMTAPDALASCFNSEAASNLFGINIEFFRYLSLINLGFGA